MKLVVVGGHSRNIGKTSVAAAVIAANRGLGWTALKLTQYGHQVCSSDGTPCECSIEDPVHPFSITKEKSRDGRTDSSRFLTAGAVESYWVRTPLGRLAEAMPSIRALIAQKPYVLMESNSVLRFLRPDLYLMVLDWNTPDFKSTARDHLDRADAFILLENSLAAPAWEKAPRSLIERRPVFRVRAPEYFSDELGSFVQAKLQ